MSESDKSFRLPTQEAGLRTTPRDSPLLYSCRVHFYSLAILKILLLLKSLYKRLFYFSSDFFYLIKKIFLILFNRKIKLFFKIFIANKNFICYFFKKLILFFPSGKNNIEVKEILIQYLIECKNYK